MKINTEAALYKYFTLQEVHGICCDSSFRNALLQAFADEVQNEYFDLSAMISEMFSFHYEGKWWVRIDLDDEEFITLRTGILTEQDIVIERELGTVYIDREYFYEVTEAYRENE